MIDKKEKIIKELKKTLISNKEIYDIWIYGSYTDQISDIDIIIIYNKLKKNIIFPKIVKSRMFGGTIIYSPKKYKNNIFLFENLDVYSIKFNKKIIFKLNNNYNKYRYLTSFLERYYERRNKFNKLKYYKSEEYIRFIKSLIISYETFYKYCKLEKIKFKKKHFLNEYFSARKFYLKNNSYTKIFNLIKKIKTFDLEFNKFSIDALNSKFTKKKEVNFTYKFNNQTTFKYYQNKKNLPFVFGELYNFYAHQNKQISKKILKDFFPKKKFYKFEKQFIKYLKMKIFFLNKCFVDLKKAKFRKGLYRLTWYLGN